MYFKLNSTVIASVYGEVSDLFLFIVFLQVSRMKEVVMGTLQQVMKWVISFQEAV